MINRTGLSILAALALIVPAVAIAGVAGPLDDPTGVLSASEGNQTNDSDGALQEESTPAASPEADDAGEQEDADDAASPAASPEADDVEDPADQDEANDIDDGDAEDVDDAEAEDAGDGEAEDDDAGETEDDDAPAAPTPGS
jgi:hypothetical protein